MAKVIITKGLPASGKTTWAKEYQQKNPNTVLVNKDDLRAMLHQGVHSKGREDYVLQIRDWIIQSSVLNGHDVVVHDTNLNPIHEERIRGLFEGAMDLNGKRINVEFEIKDFTNVTVEECIKRDQKRSNYVGEKVIKDHYKQWLKPKPVVIEKNPKLYYAIMCDIDGTLAMFGDANPYRRDFSKDELNHNVGLILHSMKEIANDNIILVSGRSDEFREETKRWLDAHNVPYKKLYMRKKGDNRADYLVKQEIYDKHIKGKYNVMFVLDDRDQVVNLWRSLGLQVFQVAEGDF